MTSRFESKLYLLPSITTEGSACGTLPLIEATRYPNTLTLFEATQDSSLLVYFTSCTIDKDINMVQYRRNRVEGASYFFTVNLKDRSKDYLTRYIHDLRHSFRYCKGSMPFTIDAIVILPEHLHCIWTLPAGDSNYSTRWRKIKTSFTQHLIQEDISISKDRHGQYDLWQRRYWERTIHNDKEFSAYVDYIHYNPVKHGYVSKVQDWKYSSFHRFVSEKKLSVDWAGENLTHTLSLVGE